ncbi:hypothetical protein GCM10010466_49450 [Planomonospora alba]|uniref:Uncharacterized protein n=1 Tax=Planomonospora alba TaxID=161354 RepID=A0ABP6NLG3_9ACTN
MHETYQPQALNPALIESPRAAMTAGRHTAAAAGSGAVHPAASSADAADTAVNTITVLRAMTPPAA